MPRIILWIVIILLSVVLQSTVIPYFSIAGISPDLLVASIMVMALWYGRLSGIWAGFFTGLLLDFWAPDNLGLQALALTTMGAFVGLFENGRINSGPISQFFLFVIAATLHDLIVLWGGIYFCDEVAGDLGEFILSQAVPRALFTSMFGMLLVFLGHQVNPYGRR